MSSKIYYPPVTEYTEFEPEHINLKRILRDVFGTEFRLSKEDISYLRGIGDAGFKEAYDLAEIVDKYQLVDIRIKD